jgi:hypothetical protein
MARKANENINSPDDADVQAAVRNIEAHDEELASLRGSYMLSCRRVHEKKTAEYEAAGNRGISKKLLKLIVKERIYERKIDALGQNLEPDERSELEMLVEKLGEFANTPLGAAAVARADGKATLSSVGA